jgi:hypothetical protein
VGRRRRGACNDNDDDYDDNGDNHNDSIGNELVDDTSDPSAQHNNQPYKRGEKEIATKRMTTMCAGG